MKGKILLVGCLLAGSVTWAQEAGKPGKADKKEAKRERINLLMKQEEEGIPSFRKHSLFGFKINNDGWGLSYELGRSKTPYRATIYQLEFNEKKHPKEDKQSVNTPVGGGLFLLGNPFVYGKQNIFYQLKLGMGQQIMIGGKGNKNGVAAYGIFAGGFSAGFLRPYYLEVVNALGEAQEVKYDSQDSTLFLSGPIIGGTGLGTGWGEMKFRPGLHAKTALRFDYGRFNNFISALEAGFNAEYYFQEVPQMVYNDPKKLFVNGYISILFGRRK